MESSIHIRSANDQDFEQIWAIFHPIAAAGETYILSPDITRQDAYDYWLKIPDVTYVAIVDGQIVGAYYLRPNQPGLGSHVCNAGFIVSPQAQGKGIGRTLATHALQEARYRHFKAMQFNCVVSTNQRAIELWKRFGFEIVGVLPKAYNHKTLGLVDLFVMYQWLGDD